MSQLFVDNIKNRTGGAIGAPSGIVVTGIVTATGGNFSGNVSIGGTLTYEDVTNIDSVGVITARSGIKIPDNQQIFLGTDNDLRIRHEGNKGIIDNTTGNLFIRADGGENDLYLRGADNVYIQPQGDENGIIVNGNGDVELYYDNVLKLETKSTGVNITGELECDTLNVATPPSVGSIRDARADGDITPVNLTNKSFNFTFTDDIAGSPNDWDSVLNMRGWENNYRTWQLLSNSGNQSSGDTNLYFRTGTASTWGSLQKVWTSENDGSSSGLDADKLDGLQATSFLRSDASSTLNGGMLTIRANSQVGNYWGVGLEYDGGWKHTNADSWGFAFRNNAANGLQIKVAAEAGTNQSAATYKVLDIGGATQRLKYDNYDVWHAGSSAISDTSGNLRITPISAKSGNYTLVATDTGKTIVRTGGNITVPSSMTAGMVVTIINNANSTMSIVKGTVSTLRSTDGSDATKTLAAYGVATVLYVSASSAFLTGSGLS